uniref:Transcription factor TFIIB cyclin-like domain-containing protein n=1 Tax=Leersia perrieri TaxID=77586 RepID=A0A0D9UZF9_9ORYZ
MDVGVVRAAEYMDRFGSLLKMGNAKVHTAKRAAQRLDKCLDARHTPESIAAAIIYITAQRSGTETSVRDVSMVTMSFV